MERPGVHIKEREPPTPAPPLLPELKGTGIFDGRLHGSPGAPASALPESSCFEGRVMAATVGLRQEGVGRKL